jgi:hypothetical protein
MKHPEGKPSAMNILRFERMPQLPQILDRPAFLAHRILCQVRSVDSSDRDTGHYFPGAVQRA